MDFHLTAEQGKWQEEVRDFLREAMTPEFRSELNESEGGELFRGALEKQFWRKVAERGWLASNWPKEFGGLEKTAIEQLILLRELTSAGAPPLTLTITSIAPTIMRFGSDENKETWIPKIAAGDVEFALGYSEPDAGSDLASLQTKAVLDGDEWVINGQKIWNSHAHLCTHEWLAVRTDPDAPKHKGISVIVVPIDSPGIEYQPLWTWGDFRTNQIFFDNVRVPKENLIGEVNRGWYYIASALDLERVAIGAFAAELERMLDEFVEHAKTTVVDGEIIANKPEVRRAVAESVRDLEIEYLFSMRTAAMIDAGLVPNKEASMLKFYGSELMTRLTGTAMRLQGLFGQLDKHDPLAPIGGIMERTYRKAPPLRFGGGANEIQRNIVAQRGLGLPRA